MDCFDRIEYTPAWYYKNWPGFFNVGCYELLSEWDKGVRDVSELSEEELKYIGETTDKKQ